MFYKDEVFRWAVSEGWVDRWAESEDKGGV